MSERIDKLLVDRGLASTRTQAQRLIAAGAVQVYLKGRWQPLCKPGQKVPLEVQFQIEPIDELRFVSRAGLKLDGALTYIAAQGIIEYTTPPLLAGLTILDIGQSTGGFTDCALQHGAQRVVGIDVGHEQLVPTLRADERVTCMEGVNARTLPTDQLLDLAPNGFDWAVMDVSFISQTLILPGLRHMLKPGGYLLSLVKPQFEVGKQGIAKGGVVKDAGLYVGVREKILDCLNAHDFQICAYFDSNLTGTDGNREFFVLAKKR